MAKNNKKATVFVVDDDANFRSVLTSLLSTNGFIVRPFESAEEFLAYRDFCRPCCLLLDVYMPGISGLELQEKLQPTGIKIPIVFISGQSEIPDVVKAMKNDAVDFLCKPFNKEELITVIEKAIEKDRFATHEDVQIENLQKRFHLLTAKEKEVLHFVALGLKNKDTAAELGIVESTVKEHRGRVMKKMQARSFLALVYMAERLGIINFKKT